MHSGQDGGDANNHEESERSQITLWQAAIAVSHELCYLAHRWNGYPILDFGTNAQGVAKLACAASTHRAVKGPDLYG
jgi:hypothetical protein